MKKTKMKLNVVITFALAILFALCSACGGSSADQGKGGSGGGTNVPEQKTEILINDPDHYYSVKENDGYIVKNCETEYVVVTPETCQMYESKALSLLLDTFEKSTGIRLTVKTDAEVSDYSATAKYISLGNTKLVEQAGINTRYAELKDKGIRIASKDSTVFILGKTGRGVYNSTLKFLYYVLGYARYTVTCASCKKDLINLRFFEFDAFDNPDIEYMTTMYNVGGQETYAEEIGIENSHTDYFVNDVNFTHNTFDILNPDVYLADHPCWYNSEVSQLCYTAWGDREEYAAMQNTIVNKFVTYIKNNPDAKAVSLTHEDGMAFCRCEHCSAVVSRYGTDAALLIRFMNDLRDLLDAKLEAESIDREIKLVFFAYDNTKTPPVTRNGAGETVPIDDTVVCKKNVCPMFTPVHAAMPKQLEDPVNDEYSQNLKGWTVIAEEFTAYLYSERCTLVESYLMPYGNFDTLQSWNKALAQVGTEFLFYEADEGNPNPSKFAQFKIYLMAKLAWDSDADVGKITEEFFDNVYLDAAEPMKRVFKDINLRMRINYDVLNMYPICFSGPNLLTSEFWPKNTLEKWLGIFDEAYAAIEKYKETDPVLYSRLYDSICIESLSPRFMYISIFQDDLAPETVSNLSKEFVKDATRLNTRREKMAWDAW